MVGLGWGGKGRIAVLRSFPRCRQTRRAAASPSSPPPSPPITAVTYLTSPSSSSSSSLTDFATFFSPAVHLSHRWIASIPTQPLIRSLLNVSTATASARSVAVLQPPAVYSSWPRPLHSRTTPNRPLLGAISVRSVSCNRLFVSLRPERHSCGVPSSSTPTAPGHRSLFLLLMPSSPSSSLQQS